MRFAFANCGLARIIAFCLLSILATSSPAGADDGAPYENVAFASLDAAAPMLSGLLLKPNGAGPFPAVVMLHGCAGMWTKSGKLSKRPTFWSQWLMQRGYVVLLADSFTARGVKSICSTRNRPITPETERPFDAYGALKFLQLRPDLRADRVALMGWSNGAMTLMWTIRTAAPQRPRDLKHDFRAAIGFYPGCVQISKQPFATKIPTTIQIGELDDWTLAEPCQKLVQHAKVAGSPIDITIHPGAYHNFDHPSSKLKTITTKNSAYASGEKQVHTGTHPEARAKAIENVAAFLGLWLDKTD